MVIGSSGRLLFGGFVAVIVSFVAASAFQEYASRAIDEASRSLDTEAMPSIEHLSSMAGEVRTTEYLLDKWVDERYGGRPADRDALEKSIARLGAEQRAYARLPVYADEGEGELADEIDAAQDDLLRAIDKAMNEYLLGAGDAAQETVDTEVSRASEQLSELAGRGIELNARESARLAALIERTRQRGLFTRWLLDVVCALFALATAFLLWRALSRSERLREEYARLQERRAQELESFSGRVAHDILSPLAAVRLSLSMAARGAETKERELLARGQRALTRVEQLTDGLLDFARAGAAPAPGERTRVGPVLEGITEELRPFAHEANAELVVAAVPDVAVACASGILTSLVSNLVRNAVKYLGDAPRRKVSVRVVERTQRVRFEVEDTGPGIDPDLADRLFQPYVRGANTGQPGLGLGLATVKRLAESHGGVVGLSSRPGTGSLFWFELPKATGEVTPAPPDERPSLH